MIKKNSNPKKKKDQSATLSTTSLQNFIEVVWHQIQEYWGSFLDIFV